MRMHLAFQFHKQEGHRGEPNSSACQRPLACAAATSDFPFIDCGGADSTLKINGQRSRGQIYDGPPGSRTILVLELADGRAFAFAAESAATAEVVVRAPWFTQALNRFCDARGIVGDERPLLPREATAREKAACIDYLDEFPEALGSLLLVGLGLP
jgi:hypothetical protein